MKKYAILTCGDMVLLTRDYSSEENPDPEQLKYFYEQHNCPSNNFSDFSILKLHQSPKKHLEADPHGLFKFHGVIELDIAENEDIDESGQDFDELEGKILERIEP